MKSYLRFLSRNKLYTTIEVVGLSVSLAFVIIMSCFVWQNMSVNSHYPDQDRMYAIGVKSSVNSNGEMAETMAGAIPELECGTTIICTSTDSQSLDGNDLERKKHLAVEKTFFEMFPTKFLTGSPEVFNGIENVIITEGLANEYGGIDLIGKKLVLEDDEEEYEFTVSAIIEDFDDTIFENARFLINLKHPLNHERMQVPLYIGMAGTATVFKVREGIDEDELRNKADKAYCAAIDIEYDEDGHLSLTRLDKIYTSEDNDGEGTGFKKGNKELMTSFSIIVVFLLISAIFNYINLNVALTGRRSKETATRMLLGEDRIKVIIRSMCESLGFMATCMCTAFLIAYVSLPYINSLIESPIPIEIRFSKGYASMYILILGMAALICGIIPAIISLKSKPIEIVKGNWRYQSKRIFSKVFIIMQNVIALIMIIVSLTMNAQIRHMINMPLNTDISDLYIARVFSSEFGKDLDGLPFVEKYGITYGGPGRRASTYGFKLDDEAETFVRINVCECDSSAFSIFGFKIIRDYGTANEKRIWITESALRNLCMDPENPVFPESGRRSVFQGGGEIAGIIEDVPFTSALNLDPDVAGIVIMEPQDPVWSEYIIKMNNPSRENIGILDKLCEEEITESKRHWAIKRYGYYPDIIEKGYEPLKKQTRMVILFMAIAIMLSALGQIAMSTYYATEHEKEIGIRKIFGGTVRSESRRNVRAYMSYCLIAGIIAVPLSIWITGRYLETFVYRMQQRPWTYIVAVAALLVISLASVLWQTIRAARTNPAEALKKE